VCDIKPTFYKAITRRQTPICLAIYVSVLPVTVPACIAAINMPVTYTYLRAYLSIWLAAPRGAADIYVSLCFGPI
jgi:hypothetical protein